MLFLSRNCSHLVKKKKILIAFLWNDVHSLSRLVCLSSFLQLCKVPSSYKWSQEMNSDDSETCWECCMMSSNYCANFKHHLFEDGYFCHSQGYCIHSWSNLCSNMCSYKYMEPWCNQLRTTEAIGFGRGSHCLLSILHTCPYVNGTHGSDWLHVVMYNIEGANLRFATWTIMHR